MTKRPRKPSKPLLLDDTAPIQSRPVKRRNPEQPHLPFDPMPDRVEPCLAELRKKPPTGRDWSWEVKWDGYRLAVHIEPVRVRLITRGGHDWTHRFPAIAQAAEALGPTTMILDGEAVVLDEEGRSDFNLLQRSLGASGKNGGKLPSSNSLLYAFDILYLDGHDLRAMEYEARRQLLEDVIEGQGAIRVSEEIEADPEALLANACSLGLEGIIGKHRDRPYRSGRTGDWVKVKCVQSETFAIIGYEPSTALPGAVASLLLAAEARGGYRYVGSVGTGFKHDEARRLKRLLDKIKTKVPVDRVLGKNVVMTGPRYKAEIEYRAWTTDGKLRHPSFKGLRDEDDAAEVYRLSE